MSTRKLMELAIELGGEVPKYGKIHKAGCRDLIDPEPIGECATKAEACKAAMDVTGWMQDQYEFAPCVKVK